MTFILGQMKGTNIEVGIIDSANPVFKLLTPSQINDYLALIE